MLMIAKTKGFTLIEVLVVIFIITIGLIGAFNVIQNVTVQSRLAASRLTAVYLAQEGIELVRNQRDTNWLGGANWGNNKTNLMGLSGSGSVLAWFTRDINIIDHGDHIEISVGVSWQDREIWHSVTSTTELYNWLP